MATSRGRMTKASRDNLMAADRAGTTKLDSGDGFMVWVERNGNRAYLHGANGPLVWTDRAKARRSVSDLGRKDLADLSAMD